MNLRILAAALAAVPFLAFAQAGKDAKPAAKPAAPATGNIATVNGVAVPRARADFLMQQQQSRGAQDNEQTRTMIREELVNREVIAQEAAKSGIAKNAEVQAQMELARQEVIVGAYLRDWVRRNPVSEADVQKEYERAKSQTGDREYRARHILVENEDQAKNLIAELKKGGKFDDLAKKNSKDTGSAERGGDLDWNVPSAYDKQFADAMTKLEKGRMTDAPVRTRFGFHIIQLDDVRPVKFPALQDVKPRIQQQLTQARIEGLIRELRSKAKVE
jgi:peptidyl-prolyl cis-trans isomerase C